MRGYIAPLSQSTLLIDIEAGELLEVPTEAKVSRRYCESHPFIEVTGRGSLVSGRPSELGFVVAGPDARAVAGGSGGRLYALYAIVSENDGWLTLRRER